jgi:membrane-bound serine protease (ClpP class)
VTLAIVLALVGFLFLLAEVFFVSMGMFGLISAGCLVAADWIAYERVSPGFMWAMIAVEVVAVPLLLKGAFAVLPRLPFGRGMMLAAAPPETHSAVERAEHLLGRAGKAVSDLRPSGTAQFGDERRSVVSDLGVIPAGSDVVVVAVEGYRIVVRAPSPS